MTWRCRDYGTPEHRYLLGCYRTYLEQFEVAGQAYCPAAKHAILYTVIVLLPTSPQMQCGDHRLPYFVERGTALGSDNKATLHMCNHSPTKVEQQFDRRAFFGKEIRRITSDISTASELEPEVSQYHQRRLQFWRRATRSSLLGCWVRPECSCRRPFDLSSIILDTTTHRGVAMLLE
jgi:hypothetical protein